MNGWWFSLIHSLWLWPFATLLSAALTIRFMWNILFFAVHFHIPFLANVCSCPSLASDSILFIALLWMRLRCSQSIYIKNHLVDFLAVRKDSSTVSAMPYVHKCLCVGSCVPICSCFIFALRRFFVCSPQNLLYFARKSRSDVQQYNESH